MNGKFLYEESLNPLVLAPDDYIKAKNEQNSCRGIFPWIN